MSNRLDDLLNRLKEAGEHRDLSLLEAAVWSRIDRQKADVFGGRAFEVQILVTCGALLMGLMVARFLAEMPMPMPLNSELVVLSDDSQVAPSVLLEGGI